ncbi:MAG TPA: hypothetical protein QGG18_10460 [Rhodospirillales bacterium]|nr:hypothetical protein [Rhodospirillales bacterium]
MIVLIAVEDTDKKNGRIRLSITPDASGKSIAIFLAVIFTAKLSQYGFEIKR